MNIHSWHLLHLHDSNYWQHLHQWSIEYPWHCWGAILNLHLPCIWDIWWSSWVLSHATSLDHYRIESTDELQVESLAASHRGSWVFQWCFSKTNSVPLLDLLHPCVIVCLVLWACHVVMHPSDSMCWWFFWLNVAAWVQKLTDCQLNVFDVNAEICYNISLIS